MTKPKCNLTWREVERFVRQLERVQRHLGEKCTWCVFARLHEAGMIKSTPQKIIAQGTDWRFLNELKKELKG